MKVRKFIDAAIAAYVLVSPLSGFLLILTDLSFPPLPPVGYDVTSLRDFRQATPPGQRIASRYARQVSSVVNSWVTSIRFIVS
jgi:hypothetical protein